MRVIIAGGGEAGLEMAKHFAPGYDVVLIEHNASLAERVQGSFDGQVIFGNAVSEAVLTLAQVSGAGLYIAVTGSDEINVLSCLAAKRLGACKTAARLKHLAAHDVRHALFKEFGNIDWLIEPEQLAVENICKIIFGIELLENSCQLAQGFTVCQIAVKPGVTVDPPVQAEFAALSREGIMEVAPGQVQQHNDRVFLLCKLGKNTRTAMQKRLRRVYERILIAGAEGVGVKLAQKLAGQPLPPRVHLYESDEELCRRAAEETQQYRVYQKDTAGTDFWQHLLTRNTDLFLVTSCSDEGNLLSALIAKSHGVETIPVVWQARYRQAVRSAGFRTIIAPNTLAAQSLFNKLQRPGGVNTVSLTGDGECLVEVIVDEANGLTGKTPRDIRLSQGILFAGCIRQHNFLAQESVGRFFANDVLLFFASAGRAPVLLSDLKLLPERGKPFQQKRRGPQV